ncbi:MAG: UDP-N-acetylmuramoyl-tripeptide--D-alanyl-D-alanine ligase, partial [bacterium]
HIASIKWPTLKNPLNWNTEIGVPLSIFDLNEKHRIAVLECASRGKGQIRHLSLIARPLIACITAIGPGHLSEFETVDEVASAKWEILDGLRESGSVVAPGDSEYTKSYAGIRDTITFGTAKINTVHPLDIKIKNDETQCRIHTPKGTFETKIPGITKADLLNALAVTSCAMQINIDGATLSLDEIAESLKTVPSVPGRMELIRRPSGIEVIFDAYNSNPLSLKNALDALCNRTKLSDGSEIFRRVAILGDMLELGDDAVTYHRDAGRRIAELPIDCLITVGELANEIRNEAERSRNRLIDGGQFSNTDILSHELINLLEPGDLVLIKASRALAFEKLLNGDW